MTSAPTRQKPAEERPASSRPAPRKAGSDARQSTAAAATAAAAAPADKAEDKERKPRGAPPRGSQTPCGTAGDTSTSKGGKKTQPIDPQPLAAAATQSTSEVSPSRNQSANPRKKGLQPQSTPVISAPATDSNATGARPKSTRAATECKSEDASGKTKATARPVEAEKGKGYEKKKTRQPSAKVVGEKSQAADDDSKSATGRKIKSTVEEPLNFEFVPAGTKMSLKGKAVPEGYVVGMVVLHTDDKTTASGRQIDSLQKRGGADHKDQKSAASDKRSTRTDAHKKERKTAVYQEKLGDLRQRLGTLNLKRNDVQRRVDEVRDLVDDLLRHFNNVVCSTGEKWTSVNSGSYYDHTKISKPDEFDIMITYSFRVKKIYSSKGPEKLFCKLQAIDSKEQQDHLSCFHTDKTDGKTYVCPKAFMNNFRKHCEDFVKKRRKGRVQIGLNECDNISPAVTFNVDAEGIKFAVDIVPSISLVEWPEPARSWTSTWIPKKEVSRIKAEDGESPNEFPCAVAKIFPSERPKKPGECRLWRISFSPVEKKIFYHADGTFRGTSVDPTIRKGVLRLLKYDVSQFNNQAVSSVSNETADCKFSSHFLKNIMLNLYDDVSGWKDDDLLERYLDGLDKVVSCLKARKIPHYFISDVNLLDRQLSHLTDRQLRYYEDKFKSTADSLRSEAGLV